MPDFSFLELLPDTDDMIVAAAVIVALATVVYYARREADRSRRAREAAQERLRTTGC